VAATWVQLVLGVLLVPMAAWQWRSRPKPDEEPGLPTWIAAIDRFTPARAGELGLALAEVNPKNLLVCVAAGRSGAQTTWLVVAFGDRGQHRGGASARLRGGPQALAGALASLRGWLTAHSACVTATLLLVIGVVLIGQGLGGLQGRGKVALGRR
jgi:hypothetical protein